jgi:hypothetical protein
MDKKKHSKIENFEKEKPNNNPVEVFEVEITPEEIQSEIERSDEIQNRIEEKGEEFVLETEDSSAVEKMKGLLSFAHKKSNQFLKDAFLAVAEKSQEKVDEYRDRRLSKRFEKISRRLTKSKHLDNVSVLEQSSTKDKKKAGDELNTMRGDLEREIATLATGNWGKSKEKEFVQEAFSKTINDFSKREIALDNESQVVSLYQQLQGVVVENGGWDTGRYGNTPNSMLRQTQAFLFKKHFSESINGRRENLDILYRDDPILKIDAISRLQRVSGLNPVEQRDYIVDQINSLVEKYPEGGSFPDGVHKILKKTMKESPEVFVGDRRLKKYFFNLFINPEFHESEYSSSDEYVSGLDRSAHFFRDELAELSEDEVTEILTVIKGREDSIHWTATPQRALSWLPLTDLHLAGLQTDYQTVLGEEVTPYSEENFLKMPRVSAGENYIALFNAEKFNLDPSEKLKAVEIVIGKDTNGYHQDRSSALLKRMVSDFEKLSSGVSPEEFAVLFDEAIKIPRKKIEDLKTLVLLAEEYNLPEEYKNKIIDAYLPDISYSVSRQLFGDDHEVVNLEKEWLLSQPEIMEKLEMRFLEHNEYNDLRHLFFDVLSGKREVLNKDALFKAYAESIPNIGSEEFINMFLIDKTIDRSYMEYFIPKVGSVDFFSRLDEAVNLGNITPGDRKEIISLVMIGGKPSIAATFLKAVSEDSSYYDNEQERIEALKDYMKSLFSGKGKDDVYDEEMIKQSVRVLKGYLNRSGPSENFSTLEKEELLSFLYESLENKEELHGVLYHNLFLDGTDLDLSKEELIHYKELFLETNNLDALNQMMGHIVNEDLRPVFPAMKWPDINDEEKKEYLEKVLNSGNPDLYKKYIKNTLYMTEAEGQMLVDSILSSDILAAESNDSQKVSLVDHLVAYRYTDQHQTILSMGGAPIYKKMNELIKKVAFSEGQEISPDHAGDLLVGNSRPYFLKEEKVRDLFLSKLLEGESSATYLNILSSYGSENGLSLEQVQGLSEKVLEKPINARIYDLYSDSTEEKPRFYMTQELFDQGVNNLVDSTVPYSTENAMSFLLKQKTRARIDLISCSKDQEKSIFSSIFTGSLEDGDSLRSLVKYDVDLFEKEILFNLGKEDSDLNSGIPNILSVAPNLSLKYKKEIVEYVFAPGRRTLKKNFISLLHHWSKDEEVMLDIKKRIKEIPPETQGVFFAELLNRDLLNPEELREFYNEAKKNLSTREQVLASAEIFGSLVVGDNPELINNFFENPTEDLIEKVKTISSFVHKYNLQEKGRTIAVMLFAKEYMADRSVDEIFEKVYSKLKKYEQVLERYEFNIPEGLRSSIGVEYEITGSTAKGYKDLTEGGDLKNDISRLSKAAHIGSGADAVHEIATRPTDNPYLLLLEMQLLNDLEYVDFNFDRSPDYQKGSRGFHLTIGGEAGISASSDVQFLQNSLLVASWGGVHGGAIGKSANGGRGVSVRGRNPGDGNNIKMFDNATASSELRSLSIDKMETFQRCVLTSHNAAIAMQAMQKHILLDTRTILDNFINKGSKQPSRDEIAANSIDGIQDERIYDIITSWISLIYDVQKATENHNEDFYDSETTGYLEGGVWVDNEEFGGEYNKKRFEEVVSSIDPTMSAREYALSTKIDFNKDLLSGFHTGFANKLTKINNLYLKPGETGDQANAISMLETTKLGNESLESKSEEVYLRGTVFDTVGEQRDGYYNVQGGSERMFTHAVQRALLDFNKKMDDILSQPVRQVETS